MAQQQAGGVVRHWLRNVGIGFLTLTLMAGLSSGSPLRVADKLAPGFNTAAAALEYQETDFTIINWGGSLTAQTTPFTNEPASSGNTFRGVLHFGGNSSNDLALIWQRDAGKLFLDLNRNRDFADDTTNAITALDPKSSNHQLFEDVHIPIGGSLGVRPVRVDINLWNYGSRPPGCSLGVHYFWQGKVALQGRDWQVGIVDSLTSLPGSLPQGQLLVRPWEKHGQPFSASGNVADTVSFTKKIFLDGHAYQLDSVAAQDGSAQPALQFTEQPVALGEVNITGRFIQQLTLQGGPYLVRLAQPSGKIKIPVGNYDAIPSVRIEQGGTKAETRFSYASGSASKRLVVSEQTPATLNVGGPLTNSIAVSRRGQNLRLDYRLVGAGGTEYQMVNQDRSHPPEFAVFKGGKQIASGKFEFG
jgi:hypothetical protein